MKAFVISQALNLYCRTALFPALVLVRFKLTGVFFNASPPNSK